MFKKGITYFILGAIAMVWVWSFFLKGSLTQYQSIEVFKTDTIFVDRPYKEVVIKEVVKSHKVYIHKVDTLIREKLIHDKLILGMELSENMAKIHTITPEGNPIIKEHQLPDFKSLKIDHEGKLEVSPQRKSRKKVWRNLERVGIALIGFYIGTTK